MSSDSYHSVLKKVVLETQVGPLVAIGDDEVLYYLGFADFARLERQIERLKQRTKSVIIHESCAPIASIEAELKAYFAGELKEFQTPLHFFGTPFQKQVWRNLIEIPYGETRSYADQAVKAGKPAAYRAVANANGVNPIAIVVPCHRVIAHDGTLGGYGGGLDRKKYLLKVESGL